MARKICYKKVKSKGPRPFVVFDRQGKAKSNFKTLKGLRKDKKFKKIKKC